MSTSRERPSPPLAAKTYTPATDQSFQTLYKEHLPLVYRYIYSKVGNREEAEDLTAQTFLKAVRSFDRQRLPTNPRRWLLQIARTTLADHWRLYYRASLSSLDQLLEAGWEGPKMPAEQSEKESSDPRVQRILQALPGQYREVLICRFLLQMSLKETAAEMQITETNAKVLQFRALRKAADLASMLEQNI